MEIRLLGPPAVYRGGAALAFPASRKVRALLAYLVVSQRALSRSHLCELFWDGPNDPRGELRWALSKLRGLLDEPGNERIHAAGDTVWVDTAGCSVDVLEIAQEAQALGACGVERLRRLATLFGGDFMEGLELDASPAFETWLASQRARFHAYRIAVLERLAQETEGAETFEHLRACVALAPFDVSAHVRLLDALARHGRLREGDEHAAAAAHAFEVEGLEATSIREAWRQARARNPLQPALAHERSERSELFAHARASLAVMPFVDRFAVASAPGGPAGALAHDVITRLAKLRSLFIVAQGTVFALHRRGIGPEEAGRALDVDFVAGGSLEVSGGRLLVHVELLETRSARIVWTEVFDEKLDGTFDIMDEIADKIVASIASEIERSERNRAILHHPNSLDAWTGFHRGLWHMYRFTRDDNEHARRFLEEAIRKDPTFARAYAALSFTHWENVFYNWRRDGAEIDRALEAAGQGVMADERDPAAHWALGRALWLQGKDESSLAELSLSVELSPNFALGHYALAFVQAQNGEPVAAMDCADRSRKLSPFDPLLFGMLAARTMALIRAGRFEEAAWWGEQAASRPNSHKHPVAIGACALALAGRVGEGRAYIGRIREAAPHYDIEDLIATFHLDADGKRAFREAARLLGI